MTFLAIIQDVKSFLSERWLPNLIGLLGGALGMYSFIDNYLLRFKPKIYVSQLVIFKLRDDKFSGKELDKIVLSTEISNKRKKYGVIYDLAVRVYKADEINPSTIIYYSSEKAEKIKLDREVTIENTENFSPISILPNSSKSLVLLFGEVVNRSKANINGRESYYYELYYQLTPNGAWRFIDKAYLYNLTESHAMEGKKFGENTIVFTKLNYDKSREKINKISKRPRTSIYRGAFHREFNLTIQSWKYTIAKPFYYVSDSIKTIGIEIKLIINRGIDKYFMIPALYKYSNVKPKMNIKFGNQEFISPTINAIEELYSTLYSLAEILNKSSKPELKISIQDKTDTAFQISCYHMSLKVYKSGDGYIQVQETNAQFGSKVRYALKLKENRLKKRYWFMENYGYTTIRSVAFRIIDFLMLHHGNYR